MKRDTKNAWYRAPIVWFGILLSALLLFGYARLLIISHKNAVEQPPPAVRTDSHGDKQLTQILGVPLSTPAATSADKP